MSVVLKEEAKGYENMTKQKLLARWRAAREIMREHKTDFWRSQQYRAQAKECDDLITVFIEDVLCLPDTVESVELKEKE